MRIAFFGTAEFAIPSLRALMASKHQVVALVTQPDRKRGRELKLQPTPTKVVAQMHDILVYQPEDASGAEALAYLRNLNADLFVVIAFGQILKKEALDIPKVCAINLHGSLLPKYRGAAPTNWAIINGDSSTGITVIRLNEKMDEGDIIASKQIPIEAHDTNITINETLSELGTQVLLEAIEMLESGKAHFEKQEKSQATLAPKLKKADGLIDWSKPAAVIHNRVRGLLPWPGAYTHFSQKALKILNTELISYPPKSEAEFGEVLDIIKGKGIVVKTGSGGIVITHLQLEGGKPLDADAFLRGHRISVGDTLR